MTLVCEGNYSERNTVKSESTAWGYNSYSVNSNTFPTNTNIITLPNDGSLYYAILSASCYTDSNTYVQASVSLSPLSAVCGCSQQGSASASDKGLLTAAGQTLSISHTAPSGDLRFNSARVSFKVYKIH